MYAAECHADESVESQTLDHSHAAYLALTDYLIDLAVYVGCEDALVDLLGGGATIGRVELDAKILFRATGVVTCGQYYSTIGLAFADQV